ncbi:MAG TPA: hypothetical protein VII66_09945 [Gemmatimonadaceae bacterium]
MTPVVHVVIAGAAGGLVSIFTSWVFMGWLFHSYQRKTPDTWRAEGPAQYALSSGVQVLAGAAVGLLFAMSGAATHYSGGSWMTSGFAFGALVWLAAAAPAQTINAIYVKIHRGVIIGELLDSLVGLLIVGCACAWAVR